MYTREKIPVCRLHFAYRRWKRLGRVSRLPVVKHVFPAPTKRIRQLVGLRGNATSVVEGKLEAKLGADRWPGSLPDRIKVSRPLRPRHLRAQIRREMRTRCARDLPLFRCACPYRCRCFPVDKNYTVCDFVDRVLPVDSLAIQRRPPCRKLPPSSPFWLYRAPDISAR